ncbi:ABC transporter permease subunit [Paracoccus aminophilus]|uniref:Autoinducer 2 import system permease protein LsrD n=1 Tax=Paracoccus aminophilus JCM 7686 TaxID=1367847 RepID=S5YGY6_PARAH|nr:sugar ABC transporter permease [Paracoccus aminophilus]AGT10733.1 ribose/xylose/arabinose/galactoside ABC-type transport systems, permease component [Paracoccus aminophilus JCM 7686]
MRRLFLRWEIVLALLLVLEIAVFGLINPRFLNVSSLLFGTADFVQIGMVAVPLTLVIIAGGIDVSFGSTIGLTAIIFGLALHFGAPLGLAVLASLAVGGFTGLFNATIIRVTRLQPLVVTLGALYLYSGAATVLSGLAGASGYEGIGNFPASFTALGYQQVLGLPLSLVIFLGLAAVMIFLLHATRFGRALFLIGLSENAARHSGLPVGRMQALTYVLLGLFAAMAGLMLSAYFGSARVDLGTTTLLPAITATVLGGASIYGGKGSVLGTVLATFLIGYLQQGLQMSGVPSQISSALSGALLVIVVAARFGSEKLRGELLWQRLFGRAPAALAPAHKN